jgi:hypothetical protein
MKTWRSRSLLLVLGALLLAWAWQRHERAKTRTVLTGEIDPAQRAARAWSNAAPEADAMLALDGRRDGSLPYAFAPRAGFTDLHVAPVRPVSLLGVVVSYAGAAPSSARLRIGQREWPLPAPDAAQESCLWLETPVPTSELTLEAPKARGAGIAEVALLPADAPTWLIAPRERADVDLEVLAAYAATQVARLPPNAELAPALARARTVVVSNAALPQATVDQLRAFIERGGELVELGPLPSVCPTPEPTPAPTAAAADDAPAADSAAHEQLLTSSMRIGHGHCTRWHIDLTAKLQFLRQGDPTLAQHPPAAASPWKPADMFAGRLNAADFDVPRADRLGFTLANQLTRSSRFDLLVSPLPNAAPALLLITADQDFVPAAGELAHSASLSGTGFTLTLTAADIGGKPDIVYPEAGTSMLDQDDVATLATRGHGVGIHPNLLGVDSRNYGAVIARHARRFRELYGQPARIVRNHHLIWSGYVAMAELLARAGLELDLDYASTHRSGEMPPGFMTGSGLPLRFIDERGRLLPIFQQATQIDDSTLIADDEAALHAAERKLRARAHELLAIALREHTAITVLHHSHWWFETHGAFQGDLVGSARKLKIPIWGADQWLRFWLARRATSLSIRGRGFQVSTTIDGVTLLVPNAAQVRVDGQTRALQQTELAGMRYGLLALPAGTFLVEPQEL